MRPPIHLPLSRRGLLLATALASTSASPAMSQQTQLPAFDTTVPHYSGPRVGEGSKHDGGLRPAVGVNLYQVSRGVGLAAAGTPAFGDGVKSDIRHHPNIAWWNDRYWVQYLPEGEAVLASSADGVDWNHTVAFANPGTIAGQRTNTHHRASFYVDEPTGKLLTSTFHGTRVGVNNAQGGFVRVVREVTGVDASGKATMGPVHGMLYNKGFETSTPFQPYTQAGDAGFRGAVDRMLDDKLFSQQFYEEHRDQGRRPQSGGGFADYGFVLGEGPTSNSPSDFEGKAFSYWTLPDGRIAGVWKGVTSGVTENGTDGWTASNIQRSDLVNDTRGRDQDGDLFERDRIFGWHGTAKIWGQKLEDGTYGVFGDYQGSEPDGRRFPLIVSTGSDGIEFDGTPLVIDGETPIMRYPNTAPTDNKDGGGAQYVRGIVEGNPRPDDATWLTYSSNKEDIWVARVPTGITGTVDGPVRDDFEGQAVGGLVEGWNTYSPTLSPVRVVDEGGNRMLRLADADPYDHAKATRVFEAAAQTEVSFRVRPKQAGFGELFIDVNDAAGNRPVQLAIRGDGTVRALDGPPPTIDLRVTPLRNHAASSQGTAGTATVSADGSAVTLTGNAWRYIPLDYQITANTVLAFDFESSERAELQGIGFDNDDDVNLQVGWKLAGTQDRTANLTWNYADYKTGTGPESFRIDAGNYFTGQTNRLVFVNDNDANPTRGNATFRNLMLFEDDGSSFTVLSNYRADEWLDVTLRLDADAGLYDVLLNGDEVATGLAFAAAVDSLERISFTTGDYRGEDMARQTVGELFEGIDDWVSTTLPGADTPVQRAAFDLDDFSAVVPEPGTGVIGAAAAGLLLGRGRSRTER